MCSGACIVMDWQLGIETDEHQELIKQFLCNCKPDQQLAFAVATPAEQVQAPDNQCH